LDTSKGKEGGPVNRESERIYDEYLVAAAVTGDRTALSRLVARWHPRLVRHAWRLLGDADRARDMAQEAWIDILRGLSRLNDVAAFPAWAYRIATRRCQREFRRKGHQPVDYDDEVLESASQVPENESGEFAVDLSSVMAAIAQLPGPQRAALALFYIEDLSVAEIAIATDVAPGTVKTRLMHARRKVRALLEGKDS
jgi:RNA polymerase sigma factor (sigma-70 family)